MATTPFAQRMTNLGTDGPLELGKDIRRCLDRGMEVVPLHIGEPDFDSAAHVNRAAIGEIEAGNSHYCDPAGILPLRRAIASHVSSTRGIAVDPGRVVVTPGTKTSIGYTLLAYVEPGDEVIYPSPGFPTYESWVTFIGARPVPLAQREERGFAFTAGDLAERVTERTRLIILCSPSNPTGGVLPAEDLEDIARVVREKCRPDVRIYSDEIYEHILFDGANHHSIVSAGGMAERTVLASGCSKSFAMTGWRLGWAVLPSLEEAAAFVQLNINTCSCLPPFVQVAGREAYENPDSEVAVAAMVAAFERRRDWVVPALDAIDGVRCHLPGGAFYVFPNVTGLCDGLGVISAYEKLPPAARARTSPSAMLKMFLLYRHGVATLDRESFGRIGATGQHYLRLSIANSMDRLEAGVGKIAAAADDAEGFAAFLDQERLWD